MREKNKYRKNQKKKNVSRKKKMQSAREKKKSIIFKYHRSSMTLRGGETVREEIDV